MAALAEVPEAALASHTGAFVRWGLYVPALYL